MGDQGQDALAWQLAAAFAIVASHLPRERLDEALRKTRTGKPLHEILNRLGLQ
jgi:hypothetical protein